MNIRLLSFLAVATFAVAAPRLAHAFDPRLWTDSSATFSIVGTLDPERSFAADSDSVFLVDDKGRTYQCPLESLYDGDRTYVEQARAVFQNNDAALANAFDWLLDAQRTPGVRRLVNVDGVDYAFRWVPPGTYTVPSEEYDPNQPNHGSKVSTQSSDKKKAPQKRVKVGFWMLETEVTLEMFNQFVTETKYRVGRSAKILTDTRDNGADSLFEADDDPYAEFDEANTQKPTPSAGAAVKSRRLGYSATPPQYAGLSRGDEYTWKNPGFPQTKKNPVTLVSVADANAFCAWLSSKIQKNVALPTTAQWLLASQPESVSLNYVSLFEHWAFGGSGQWERGNLPDANYPVICPRHVYLLDRVRFVYRDSYRFTVPVGSFKPNNNGLYDMIGNVGEMTADSQDVVESLGGSWFHLPGYNPICWIRVSDLGYDSLDRSIFAYQASRPAPRFAAQVAQPPYNDSMYGLPSYDMYDNPTSNARERRLQGNPFAQDNSIKPFKHISIPDVDATCYTGFRVIVQ